MSRGDLHDVELREQIAETYGEDVLLADGHDNAVVGVVHRCGEEPFVVYDYDRVIANYEAEGMTNEEAVEYMSFNFMGAWHGPFTPGVIEKLRCEE